jgi:nicotinamide-nucleotide amidase
MRVEILNTGSELMLGFVTNTHLNYLARKLGELGLEVARQICVGDNAAEMGAVFRECVERSDVLIVTGGLGPTRDDITREVAAQIFRRKLSLNEAVLQSIRDRFALSKRPMPKQVEVQAMVPEGATVLPNANGTAPGLALEVRKAQLRGRAADNDARETTLVLLLPGPPRELQPMFEQHALPLLRQFAGESPPAAIRILRIACLGESFIAERIGNLLDDLSGIELGYCARPAEVDVRIVARPAAGAKKSAAANADEAVWRIRSALGFAIYAEGQARLEEVVVRLLTQQRQTVAVAESCTGGFLSNRLTNVSGASAVFINGLVTYANEAKNRLLGVSNETLQQHGAVSEPVARQMAQAVRLASRTDYGIGITGIAGPTGGTPEKPLGTTFLALASADGVEVTQHTFRFDRETFKFVVSQYALEKLRRHILKLPPIN